MSKIEKISEMDYEINFYKGILEKSPNFVEALSAIGDLYTKKGLYEEGLKVDLRLAVLRPDDPVVLYNLACSYSLLNNIDVAFMNIKKAINCGYSDIRHMEQDQDLDNLRKDARFKRYFSRIVKKKVA